MAEKYVKIMRNGKFYFILLLSVIPGVCFKSINQEYIKIGVQELRCDIKEFQKTTWNFNEIREVSSTYKNISFLPTIYSVLLHNFSNPLHECYIYQYDYKKIANMTFKDAETYIAQVYPHNKTTVLCEKFIPSENFTNTTNYPESYPQEVNSHQEILGYNFYNHNYLVLVYGILRYKEK